MKDDSKLLFSVIGHEAYTRFCVKEHSASLRGYVVLLKDLMVERINGYTGMLPLVVVESPMYSVASATCSGVLHYFAWHLPVLLLLSLGVLGHLVGLGGQS